MKRNKHNLSRPDKNRDTLSKLGESNKGMFIGAHVSIAGGVWNAPKNAADLGCETFQIFSRSPQGGPAPKLDKETIKKFKDEMAKYYPPSNSPPKGGRIKKDSPPKIGGDEGGVFVIHCPYFINFGSIKTHVFYGSISVVREELERGSLLGAKYVMMHLGSFKDLGEKKGMKQVREGLKKVLERYKGKTEFLLEIAAGAGSIIGDTFEELAEIMEPLKKIKGFGGICFDTQHAFASGYDLRTADAVLSTFAKFDKVIGLKWLKMSHVNDSQTALGSRKDRHEHIGQGKIGIDGFSAFLCFLSSRIKDKGLRIKDFPLILETEHDKVKADIKVLKGLRDSLRK